MRLSFIFNPNILKQGSPIRSQAAHWEEHNGGQAREALFAAPHGLLPMAHITPEPSPAPQSVSSMKLVLGTKKVGNHCPKVHLNRRKIIFNHKYTFFVLLFSFLPTLQEERLGQ